jgi:calmodulin
VRDQDQDWTTDAEGNKVRRDNPILEGFQDQQKIHDPAALRMHQAGERMLEENELFDNTRIRGANAPQPKHGRLAKPEKKSLRRLFNQLDVDRNGTLDEHELVALAAAGGKKLSRRQLAEAMAEMDADGSGSVEYEEFEKWWEHGAQHPPQGTEVFRRITAQLETKFSNLRGVFRKFDENHDGTLSHHEFRKGLELAGIPLEDQEFKDLLKTLDEDNSNEIDYNEFADSGMMGGKYFAARDPKGFSGCTTKAGLLDKRKRVERAFGQDKMNTLWSNTMSDPKVAIGQLVWAGGGGM